MVFPIGAYRKEFAADHLDRLLGKSILDRFIHKRGVTEDGHTSRSNQPEHGRDGRSPDAQRNRDDQQTGVELGRVKASDAEIQIATFELPDTVETTGHQDDDEEQHGVGQQAVDAQHHKHDGIVAGEVRQVVVDAALDLAKVGWLGQTLQVEELGHRTEVGETRAERLGADAVEALAEARGDGVDRDLNGTHSGDGSRVGPEVG